MSPALWLLFAAGGAAEVTNPHGAPDGCDACHVAGASPTEAGTAKPIVATCRACHPTADMHPVGMAPRDVHVPASWPLENGLVTCATCHAEPAHGAPYRALPAPWHRNGPYPKITDLCYSCHESTEYTREDPHHPQVARDADDPSCSACHTTEPAAGASIEEAKLRFPTAEACATCHTGEVHAGVTDHLGVRAEVAAWTDPLKLAADQKIACWTCHDVHGGVATPPLAPTPQADAFHRLVLARDWTTLTRPDLDWPGTYEEGHPPLLARPIDDGALCRSCHREGR